VGFIFTTKDLDNLVLFLALWLKVVLLVLQAVLFWLRQSYIK